MTNYTNNLRRLGLTDADLTESGSDRLVDALVLEGDDAAVATDVVAHLDAGANHVVIAEPGSARSDRPGTGPSAGKHDLSAGFGAISWRGSAKKVKAWFG
ncbi:hypothetical protein AB0F17_24955 [Nonomuraea sp. NPDC026600]|uniref:hypothetical protein n=1 Tax=Nonomuraea sp. NPDC026600 TaxID=3155363 RepID=UPI0033F72508